MQIAINTENVNFQLTFDRDDVTAEEWADTYLMETETGAGLTEEEAQQVRREILEAWEDREVEG